MSTESTQVIQRGYKNDLMWQKHLDQFAPDEQKVLLALSHVRYRWRSRDRLLEVTGLAPSTLDAALAKLLSQDIVRPAFSKGKKIIFGLRERVG
jgi:hypothetical protein